MGLNFQLLRPESGLPGMYFLLQPEYMPLIIGDYSPGRKERRKHDEPAPPGAKLLSPPNEEWVRIPHKNNCGT